MKNKTAYFGVFTSLALILSYVETLIPISFGIPGIKLGLANLVIVIVLYTYGGDKTGAGKSGNRHCFVYIWRKRSVSFICNQNSAVRIFVWESEYDSLQYGRGRFQSRHHGVAS